MSKDLGDNEYQNECGLNQGERSDGGGEIKRYQNECGLNQGERSDRGGEIKSIRVSGDCIREKGVTWEWKLLATQCHLQSRISCPIGYWLVISQRCC